MANDEKILFPNREVKFGEGANALLITVRELAWPDALEFLKELGGYLGKLMNEQGEIRVDPAVIVDLVTSTDELTTSLLRKATGLDAEAQRKLSLGQALDLLDVALDLNLSEDLFARGKKLAGRFEKFAAAVPRGKAAAAPASAKFTSS